MWEHPLDSIIHIARGILPDHNCPRERMALVRRSGGVFGCAHAIIEHCSKLIVWGQNEGSRDTLDVWAEVYLKLQFCRLDIFSRRMETDRQ